MSWDGFGDDAVAMTRQVVSDHGGTPGLFRKLQTAYEQLVNWADDPVFTTRRGFPDKWFYDGYANRWIQPTPVPRVV